MEHVTRHMIYSRFWHKFLYDLGVVPVAEPYAKRTAQGLILGSDGEKMSKSRGNVVDPNDMVDVFGADVLRTYVLFMGDYGSAAPWNESSMKGCKRFLERFGDLMDMAKGEGETPKLTSSIHKVIKKVSLDIEELKFNTAIAAMMGLLNDIYDQGTLTRDELSILVRLLCPFAPHLAEEMWQDLGGKGLCSLAEWPVWDEAKTVDSTVEVAVQVNGKVRATIELPLNCPAADAIASAKANEKIVPFIEGKTVIKEISIPNKIINIVVK
jgi:leucyl-tRNA synthetase